MGVGGIAPSTGADPGAGAGGAAGINGGQPGQPVTACVGTACGPSTYVIKAIYFNPKMYKGVADCLTAAQRVGVPRDMCR